MKNHKNTFRGYYRSSRAWYAQQVNSANVEVMFGLYGEEGGTTGEMKMEWIKLDGKLCAQLNSFEDSWSALSLFDDLIQKLGKVDGNLIQEDDFCKILDECGFKDLTNYQCPYERPQDELISVTLTKKKAKELNLI